jgi:NAD(P)H-dependent FMN reductase
MNLLIVSASHRAASQSIKVARFAAAAASRLEHPFETIELLDLAQADLPFWIEDETRPGSPLRSPESDPLFAQIAASDAFVFVTPEWSGMVPPRLINLLILCNRNELAHKPALLVGISSGLGGSYPLAHLRASSPKDTHICYIPEALVIRNVRKHLDADQPADADDLIYRCRLQYSLSVLRAYAVALKGVRESGVIDLERYPYGF